MTRKVVGFIIGSILFVALVIVAYENWPQRLPATDASALELVKFCTSDQFANLDESQKLPYVEALMKKGIPTIIAAANEAKLTQDERQRGLENALQAGIQYRWGQHLDNWMQLDPKAKQEYVKKVAAQMPMRPPGINTPGPSDPSRNGKPGARGGRFSDPARHKAFIENMSPDRRAAMAEFMSDLRAARGEK